MTGGLVLVPVSFLARNPAIMRVLAPGAFLKRHSGLPTLRASSFLRVILVRFGSVVRGFNVSHRYPTHVATKKRFPIYH